MGKMYNSTESVSTGREQARWIFNNYPIYNIDEFVFKSLDDSQ